MGISFSIGYTTKAVNSTSRVFIPQVSGDALIKEPSDYRNPVLQVKGAPGTYNYMSFSKAYYWVDKVVSFPNGIIEVHAHIDPLATYQDEIAGTKVFAAYHSNNQTPLADDPRFSPEKISYTDGTTSDIFDSTVVPLGGGSVILTVFEAGYGTSNQGVKTYAVTLSTFRSMLINLQTSIYDTSYNNSPVATSINNNFSSFTTQDDTANMVGAVGTTLTHSLIKGLSDIISNIGGMGSWRDNLIKAVYVPFALTNIPDHGSKNIHLGFLDTGTSGNIVDPVYVKTKSGTVDIPWDGKCSTYPFLKNSRFTQFQAICCGGQSVTFSADLIKGKAFDATLGWYSAVDIMSGDWSCVLTTADSSNKLRLASFGGNFGIDITGMAGKGGLGAGMNYTIGGLKIAANALTYGLAGQAMQGSNGATAGQIGCGIVSNFLSNTMGNAGNGVTGSGISSVFLDGASGYNNIHIEGVCGYPAICDGLVGGEYNAYCQQYGYPCNQYVTLSLDNSYVVCSGAFVKCKGNQQDQAFVNSVLNSGILLEA